MKNIVKIQSAKLILAVAGLAGLGYLVGAADEAGAFQVVERRVIIRREPDMEQPMPFESVPQEVRQAIRELGHERDVVATFRLVRTGESFFRMTIKTRGTERVVLAEPNGYVRNVEDVRYEDLPFYRDHPNAWYKDYDDRMLAHQKYFLDHVERITATYDRPEQVRWDELPGGVRATCARESGGDRINDVVRYRTRENTIVYQTEIRIDRDHKHVLQVLPDGRIFNEKEYRPTDNILEKDWKTKSIGYSDLPDKVRWVVDREAPKGRIPHVDVATRKGGKIYTVQIVIKDGTRYLTMNQRGEILTDVAEHWQKR